MSKAPDFIFYTDGGAELGKSAAAAAIIENTKTAQREHLVCYLGPGTNNEAEIFAGLIAFARLRGMTAGKASIRWVCDSQYVLQSATQYIHNWQKNGWKTSTKQAVKNQGLWRAYLQLASGYSIISEHVRGHTGHPENEACDFATNWVRANASYLDGKKSFEEDIDGTPWLVFDARDWMGELRDDEPTQAVIAQLLEIPSASEVNGDERTHAAIQNKLLEVKSLAKQLGEVTPELKKLLKEIDSFVS